MESCRQPRRFKGLRVPESAGIQVAEQRVERIVNGLRHACDIPRRDRVQGKGLALHLRSDLHVAEDPMPELRQGRGGGEPMTTPHLTWVRAGDRDPDLKGEEELSSGSTGRRKSVS